MSLKLNATYSSTSYTITPWPMAGTLLDNGTSTGLLHEFVEGVRRHSQ